MPDASLTVLAAAGRLAITPQRYEIMFKDGTSIGLHRVYQGGTPVTLLRALRYGDSLIVFDLSQLCRELASELPQAAARDVHGLIFYTLRSRFSSADAVIAKILQNPREVVDIAENNVATKEPA